MQTPETNYVTVLALSIHSSINSRNCFFKGVEDHNFEEKATVCVIH